MKIRISKNLFVDSRTIIHLEWHKYYPRLVIHEKFEKHLKWVLRCITVIGIASSILTFDSWYKTLAFSVLIFLVQQFLERTTKVFTTMVAQPPPDFKIDYDQWKTNGFLIPSEKNSEHLAHFGPSFQSEAYAVKFFDYLRSWVNNDSFDDTENNLVVSIVIEPDERYTTYIYANPKRKRLDQMFKLLGDTMLLEKYGKRQQQLLAQMVYWNTLDYKDGSYIAQFLEFHQEGDTYHFTPSVIQPFGLPPNFLVNSSIKKSHLQVRNRNEVQKGDLEDLMKPGRKVKINRVGKLLWRRSDEVKLLADIQQVFSEAEDLGFTPSDEKSIGVINMCFNDHEIAMEAYKQLLNISKGEVINLDLIEEGDTLGLSFSGQHLIEPIRLSGIPINRDLLQEFLKVNGGSEKVIFAIGTPPSQSRRLILFRDMSPLQVNWKYINQ